MNILKNKNLILFYNKFSYYILAISGVILAVIKFFLPFWKQHQQIENLNTPTEGRPEVINEVDKNNYKQPEASAISNKDSKDVPTNVIPDIKVDVTIQGTCIPKEKPNSTTTEIIKEIDELLKK